MNNNPKIPDVAGLGRVPALIGVACGAVSCAVFGLTAFGRGVDQMCKAICGNSSAAYPGAFGVGIGSLTALCGLISITCSALLLGFLVKKAMSKQDTEGKLSEVQELDSMIEDKDDLTQRLNLAAALNKVQKGVGRLSTPRLSTPESRGEIDDLSTKDSPSAGTCSESGAMAHPQGPGPCYRCIKEGVATPDPSCLVCEARRVLLTM